MNVGINNLIQITANGIVTAEYVDIKDTIVAMYKNVYGSDIDIDPRTADGVFIENVCLIIYNILQCYSLMYSNLNPQSATGIYLDIIGALTNVTRKQATKSRVSVRIKNVQQKDVTINVGGNETFKLIDKSGQSWTVIGGPYTLIGKETWENNPKYPNYEGEAVIAECDAYGAITAPAHYVEKTMTVNGRFVVSQPDAGETGTNRESDAEFRARRNNVLSATSTTVIEGLVSALGQINGIDDVVIMNNSTDSSISTTDLNACSESSSASISEDSNLITVTDKDGSQISIYPHAVYILSKYLKYVTISNQLIGSTIYRLMTPGVSTTHGFVKQESTADSSIINETLNYIYHTENRGSESKNVVTGYTHGYNNRIANIDLDQYVYWKECVPVAPTITIKITPREYFSGYNDDDIDSSTNATSTPQKIIDNVISYCNGLQIGTNLSVFDIQNKVYYSDPLYRNSSTFAINSITIDNQQQIDPLSSETSSSNIIYKNPLTYYGYETSASKVTNEEDGTVTITISGKETYIDFTE